MSKSHYAEYIICFKTNIMTWYFWKIPFQKSLLSFPLVRNAQISLKKTHTHSPSFAPTILLPDILNLVSLLKKRDTKMLNLKTSWFFKVRVLNWNSMSRVTKPKIWEVQMGHKWVQELQQTGHMLFHSCPPPHKEICSNTAINSSFQQ